MKKTILIQILIIASVLVKAQVTLDYYLPSDVTYNSSTPTPKQIAGHEIGEWHLTHDKLYFYMLELARVSERAVWEEYGKSHEGRPLGQLIISSPENIRNIEQLRQQHLLLCDPSHSGKLDISIMPVFIKLGYGVHGNESSAQNASTLVAYYLVAGEGAKIDELLKNAVILVDPSLNPDGMQRHSTWVNFTKSLNNNPDANSWEFSENWPGGRTNHYWFDLNRDYIMLQHPESVGRVAAFFRWRPNINTDHHEMGANATFFFQPGVQSRNNPLTPSDNQALTAEVGLYHEKYLNRIGSLYYAEEGYDDFYVSKGSSYPDIHGSVGILFEQAGVKGHLRNTVNGLLSFPFAIRNQFNVSLSSLEAGLNMKNKLLESQRKYFTDIPALADRHPVKAYIFTEPDDNYRLSEFIKNLLYHKIRVYRLSKDIIRDGITYRADNSYVVPLKQNEHRFIRSLFEPIKEFTDSAFYDVSTWVLPMSFNIQYSAINVIKEMEGLAGAEITETPVVAGKIEGIGDLYAYLFGWNEYLAPKALYALQSAGIITKVATGRFTYDDGSFRHEFLYGTILVPVSGQSLSPEQVRSLIGTIAADCRITVYGVSTSLTPEGIDLGSSGFTVLRKPSILMIVGDGTNSTDAGEIWHMLDTRFNMPVTMVTASRFGSVDLSGYNVLIITGSPDISPAGIENISTWNRQGGTLIGYESGNNWLARNKLAEIEYVPEPEPVKKEGEYANRTLDNLSRQIPGSIFETELDLTHPLCYGITRDRLPVFKSGASASIKDKNIYNNPVIYSSNPLLSGYCSKTNAERLSGSAFASVHGARVISIYDNTNFRAVWYGTNKIFMNAVFFGQILGQGRYEYGE
ncbi:MAG: M14 family zinc carboxypeptidase [Bacteroidota bacterium]